MPNSLLWVCLVAVWLFVLVPMVINRGRPQTRMSTVIATSTRTLHRGGARAPAGRKKPGAHPSDPAHKPSRAPSPTAIALLEKKEAELQAVQVGADVTAADDAEPSESPVVDASRADDAGVDGAVADGTGADDVGADGAAGAGADDTPEGVDNEVTVTTLGVDLNPKDTEVPSDETDRTEGEYHEPDEAPETDSDVTGSDDTDTVDTVSGDLDDPEPADDPEEDLIDDDLLAEAMPVPARVERAPVTTTAPRRVSPSRSKESLADKHSEARYEERQRVLLGLIAVLFGSIIAGLVLGAIGWVLLFLVTISLVAYLAFLRRAVVREQQARVQRQARAARLRREEARRREREEQQARLRPVVPELPRRRRPGGAVVLEIDDEDPVFEHLPSGPRSNLYYGDVSDDEYRRAVG
ncbi:gephyrin-like molybdotransferase receptor GlpR [Gordonia sp. (in: high G+C Gram-positive bacteria)]|jgi:hypothetical protein|uniref:divisome protein SepX/GlpR n=1 Tax=Gordonia sp. (in: high G+C Gram-positive bacteria) TaxID=84139 RepID=UPI0026292D56|nr:gephyrin-like molybdotransferase receptor GlpR [Gordonia sp. (in: high G+C Gram-positive bacteria)]HMS76305.1 hypothetical protein [Gordonia sp. (in: high G+C Gram-positive bacteria)]HQV18410.1 hypothetical protein [Gordonia sp. (in: high G+C Gram-positive bacteria)]